MKPLFAFMVAAILTAACKGAGPEPIMFKEDSCAHCRMRLSDRRFGGEVISKSGKPSKFDSLDCLLSFYREHRADTASVWVVDTLGEGALVPVEKATFADVSGLRSPMGRGVVASLNGEALQKTFPGAAESDWSEVQKLFP